MTGQPAPLDLAIALARLEALPCPDDECRALVARTAPALRSALDSRIAGLPVDPDLLGAISRRFEPVMPRIEALGADRGRLDARFQAAFKKIVADKLGDAGLGDAQAAPAPGAGRTLAVAGLAAAAGIGLCCLLRRTQG